MAGHGKVRIGILGAARIARQFVEANAGSTAIEIAGVAARDVARAEAFASDLGIARVYESYEALLAAPEVEAIYLPLPNSLHAEWAIKATAAGKHVLSEKPLAANEAEAKAMFAAARAAGVHLVEAYPYLAQPQTLKAREIMRAGTLGRPRLIRTSFGVQIADLSDIRYDPKLAGGALMDAGSYAVSMLRVMAGERPTRVTATPAWAQTGVDHTMLASLEFASGLVGQIAASFVTAYHRHAHIACEEGIVETTYLNHPPIGGPPTVHVRRGRTATAEAETITCAGGNGFRYEADAFAAMLREGAGHWNGASEQESLDIAATLAAILESARAGKPVDIAA